MDIFSRRDLRDLMTFGQKPCVSIAMRTTHGVRREDTIRWKNQVREAEQQLIATGLRKPDAEALLEPARALRDDAPFWSGVSDGLVGFVAPGLFKMFRVPIAVADEVVVAEHFNVKPLVPLFTGEGRFFVLLLSQRRGLKVLQCTQHRVHDVALEEMPPEVHKGYEYGDESPQPGPGNPTRGGPVRHKHGFDPGGMSEYTEHKQLREYFHQVDRGLRELLRDDTAPLVLAGEPPHIAIYHEANSYRRLLPGGVEIHPEQWQHDQVRDKAWDLVQADTRQGRERNVALYRQLAGTGRTANRIEEVVPAAFQGGIQILFASRNPAVWGRFDPAGPHVERHDRQEPGDEDLVNLAVVHCLTHGGQVYVVNQDEMPDGGPLAAIHWLPLGERTSKRTISEAAGR